METIYEPIDSQRWREFVRSGGRATLTSNGYREPLIVIYRDNDGAYLAVGLLKVADKLVSESREQGTDPGALAFAVAKLMQFDDFTYSTCLRAISRAKEALPLTQRFTQSQVELILALGSSSSHEKMNLSDFEELIRQEVVYQRHDGNWDMSVKGEQILKSLQAS